MKSSKEVILVDTPDIQIQSNMNMALAVITNSCVGQ